MTLEVTSPIRQRPGRNGNGHPAHLRTLSARDQDIVDAMVTGLTAKAMSERFGGPRRRYTAYLSGDRRPELTAAARAELELIEKARLNKLINLRSKAADTLNAAMDDPDTRNRIRAAKSCHVDPLRWTSIKDQPNINVGVQINVSDFVRQFHEQSQSQPPIPPAIDAPAVSVSVETPK